MLPKHILDNTAKPIIVLYSFNFRHLPQSIKCLIIEVIDMGHVGVRNYDIRQLLHIPNTIYKGYQLQDTSFEAQDPFSDSRAILVGSSERT